jgi:hypothetical protein
MEATTSDLTTHTTQQQPLTILSLDSDGPKPVGETVTLSLSLRSRSSVECILCNFKDGGQEVLLGAETCVSDATTLDVHVLPSDDVIKILHIFHEVGSYVVEIKVWNSAADDSDTVAVTITEDRECQPPEAEIHSMGMTVSTAALMKLNKPYLLSGRAKIKCKSLRAIKSKWKIQKYNSGAFGSVVFATEGNLQMYLPSYTVDSGVYRISFDVFPEGFESVTTSVEGYIEAEPSPIHVVISGGTTRSVAHGSVLVLDGSESRDPDIQDGGGTALTFKWSCWKLGDLPIDTWCHGNNPGSQKTLILDSKPWTNSASYMIRLDVSNAQKTSSSLQQIDFVDADIWNIAIMYVMGKLYYCIFEIF